MDEASQLRPDLVNLVYGIMNELRPEKPFKIVWVADFCQLPPVHDAQVVGDSGPRYAFESDEWKRHVGDRVITLQECHRQEENSPFLHFLQRYVL